MALARAPVADAVFAGRVESAKLEELSGLAASRRRDDLLWAINDGARRPRLHALSPDGRDRGHVRLPGDGPVDWEALASFDWEGRPYLLVADTGDNLSWRRESELWVVPEPVLAGDTIAPDAPVPVAWRIRFRFDDGPRDCEAVAVDAEAGRALLLAKRTRPPLLYAVSLAPDPAGGAAATRVARRVGSVPGIPPPTEADVVRLGWLGRYAAMPTGLDLSPDGRRAAVLTYRDAYLFERRPGESWERALARVPRRIPLPPMRQAEAISFARDGAALFVSGEGPNPPLFRFDPAEPVSPPPGRRPRSPR